jgi:virginiamycin B lyase
MARLGLFLVLLLLGGPAWGFTIIAPPAPSPAGSADEQLFVGGQYNDPKDIVLGPDGNLYFAQAGATSVGKAVPGASIALSQFGTLSGTTRGIAVGPDGNLWLTEPSAGKVARVTLSGGVTEFTLPVGASARTPQQIVAGPDGNLWFCDSGAGAICRMTTSGTLTTFPITFPSPTPQFLVAGPDGNIWFTEPANNFIGQITMSGTFTTFSTGLSASAGLRGIAIGPNGNLWFGEISSNRLGTIQVSTPNTITEYVWPSNASAFQNLTTGPDLKLWGTENAAPNHVAEYIDPTEPLTVSVAAYTSYTTSVLPFGICNGPNHDIWVTLSTVSVNSGVGRIPLPAPAPVSATISAVHVTGSSYTAMCPTTPQGIAALLTRVADLAPRRIIRAFTWDATTQRFVELPALPADGLQVHTGVFIASTIGIDVDIAGTASIAPYDIPLHPQWNLVGVPALVDGANLVTTHPLTDFTLYGAGRAAVTGASRTAAIGTAAFWWDGSGYQSVTTLESGRSYWILNNTTQDLTLTRVNTLSGGVVFLGAREIGVGGATSSGGGGSPQTALPPALPTLDRLAGHQGCGSGGAALVLGLAPLAWWRRRRPVEPIR